MSNQDLTEKYNSIAEKIANSETSIQATGIAELKEAYNTNFYPDTDDKRDNMAAMRKAIFEHDIVEDAREFMTDAALYPKTSDLSPNNN